MDLTKLDFFAESKSVFFTRIPIIALFNQTVTVCMLFALIVNNFVVVSLQNLHIFRIYRQTCQFKIVLAYKCYLCYVSSVLNKIAEFVHVPLNKKQFCIL